MGGRGGRRADLSKETLGAYDCRELRVHDLEGDGSVMLEVAGEIDRSHPTAPELALDRVAVRQGGDQTLM